GRARGPLHDGNVKRLRGDTREQVGVEMNLIPLAARGVKRCQRAVTDVGAGRELGQQNPWMKKENPSIPGIAARREIGARGFGIRLLAEVFDCVDAIAQLRAAFDVAVAGGGAIGCDAERYDALTRK